MTGLYEQRLRRIQQLSPGFPEAGPILKLYVPLLRLQSEIYEAGLPAAAGPAPLLSYVARLRKLAAQFGPAPLRHVAELTEQEFTAFWHGHREYREGSQFYLRVLLQPWVERLRTMSPALDQEWAAGEGCPFCSAPPASAVLRPGGDSGQRSLACSLCAGEWPFKPVSCPTCGETDPELLPGYRSEEIPQVQVEACETCRCYLKTIDLRADHDAIPVVDELVTISLNLWAEESGYRKREPNLFGM